MVILFWDGTFLIIKFNMEEEVEVFDFDDLKKE